MTAERAGRRCGRGTRARLRLALLGLLGLGIPVAGPAAAEPLPRPAYADRIPLALLSLKQRAAASPRRAPVPMLDFSAMPASLAAGSGRLATLTWRYTERWWRLSDGMGLDLEVADAGNLHLAVMPAQDPATSGLRGARLWSLGASFDLVHTVDADPHRRETERYDSRLVLSPQLLFDLDRLTDAPGNAQLVLQHSNWREAETDRILPDRVWQLSLRWEY